MAERQIRIRAGDFEIAGVLNETPTAGRVWDALPIEASGSTWGDEIYFRIPVQHREDDAQETVKMGDIGYWPPGQALCLFFGPTPMSTGDEIRPASPVNVIGRMEGEPTLLKSVGSGERVVVDRV
jgi:hypothetical protein